MDKVIEIILKTIEGNSHSDQKSRDIELLIKAKSIEILKPQAASGIGFAMEAISKIAASTSSKEPQIISAIDNLANVLSMALENQGKSSG